MNYVVLLSGGTGTRVGLKIPKQYYIVNDRSVISYVIESIEKVREIDGYIIVASREWEDFISKEVDKHFPNGKFLGFANPGETRQLSIINGLVKIGDWAKEDDLIIIQDAARPNTSSKIYQQCITLSDGEDGAMPVLPMKDTVYMSKTGKKIDSLVNRDEIYAGQAPESFRYGKYFEANKRLSTEEIAKIKGSTEPAVMYGMNIKMFDGDEYNFKITTENDLKRFVDLQKER